MTIAVAVLLAAATSCAMAAGAGAPPEQVHIGFGMDYTAMRVNWATLSVAVNGSSFVQWGPSPSQLTSQAADTVTPFTVDAGRTWSVHTAEMTGLAAFSIYYYRVGNDDDGWSQVFQFRSALPKGEEPAQPQRYVVYGDLGASNAYSLCWDCDSNLTCVCNNKTAGIISEIGAMDMVLHVGDFAYNFDDDNGRVGDQFMRNMEPVAATTPYMVSHGNHESAQRFAHYTERYRHMPTNTGTVKTDNGIAPNNWYYSFDHGLVHFAAISTEIYFDFKDEIEAQFNWLDQDLKSVNRSITPWVIVHGHRSVYCSCDTDCLAAAKDVREGQFGLEQLFHKYGVDLFINGHEHNYERMYDIYQGKTQQTTKNPKATTYIITGAAGCGELHEPFILPQPSTSAFRANIYGYSRFFVYNATHMHWQQVQTQKDRPIDEQNYGSVIDDVWYVQENHGPFTAHQAVYDNIDMSKVDKSKSVTMDFVTRETYTGDKVPTQYVKSRA